MTGWTVFAVAYAAFLAAHLVPVRPAMRVRLMAVLGRRGFTGAYVALSLALLALLIAAAGKAPFVPLWAPEPWQKHVALAANLAALIIAALAIGRPNPYSFGGAGAFDPARPGIVALARHPLLAALALWAAAHVIANGDLAHVTLFGGFVLFALAGMRAIDRRRALPPLARRRPVPRDPRAAGLRIGAGALAWAGTIALHPTLFGVSPLP